LVIIDPADGQGDSHRRKTKKTRANTNKLAADTQYTVEVQLIQATDGQVLHALNGSFRTTP